MGMLFNDSTVNTELSSDERIVGIKSRQASKDYPAKQDCFQFVIAKRPPTNILLIKLLKNR